MNKERMIAKFNGKPIKAGTTKLPCNLKYPERMFTRPVQTPNFGHYAAITSGFKSFLMIALWYSLGGLSLRLP
jgi:hypothetical protein